MKSNLTVIVTGLLIFLLMASGCKSTEGKTNIEAQKPPNVRFVMVLRDVTPSFQSHKEANEKIRAIVNALGPGDSFLLADVAPTFLPEKNVRVQCNMPEAALSFLQPTSNLSQWKRSQARLDAIWATVGKNKKTIANWLRNPMKVERGGTDLFRALEYCAQRMSRESGKEKYLFIFSDLIHEMKREKTEKPPSTPLNFEGVHITVLFAPWQGKDKWQSKEKDWKAWFVKQGRAATFSMYEPADSKLQSLLKQSRVLKKLPSPFN